MVEVPRQCPRCQNKDPAYFFLGAKGWYCRKCIGFRRFLLSDHYEKTNELKMLEAEYFLPFKLSKKQRVIAEQVKENYRQHNILIYAACGSGKTELMLEFIVDALRHGWRVGWAIPRRQVVLQLANRLRTYFPTLKVIAVCQGYTNIVEGDLIVCTTHQLYRYYQYFDYLIIDEPDAFPFKENEVLQNVALSACKGKLLFLTATPDEFVRRHSSLQLELFVRPHKRSLDIPQVIQVFRPWDFLVLGFLIRKSKRKLIVFVASIKLAESLHRLLTKFCDCAVISSQTENKEKTVWDFIKQKKGVLVSTTILERGVTIPDIDVVVFRADSEIFDQAALIQMAGRVGRSYLYPQGDIWFITNYQSKKVQQCIQSIEKMNQLA